MLSDYIFKIMVSAVIVYTIAALTSFFASFLFNVKDNKYVCIILSFIYFILIFIVVFGWRSELTTVLGLPVIAMGSEYYGMAFLGISISVSFGSSYVFYRKIR